MCQAKLALIHNETPSLHITFSQAVGPAKNLIRLRLPLPMCPAALTFQPSTIVVVCRPLAICQRLGTHTVHTKHHNEPHIQQQTLLHTLYNSHSHIISVCQAIFFECMQLYWPWPKNAHTLAGATTQRTVVHRRSPLCTSMRCKQARAKWLAARLECTNSIVGASLDKDQQHMMSSMRYYILPTFECKTTPHVFISLFWATTAQYMGEQGMESEP